MVYFKKILFFAFIFIFLFSVFSVRSYAVSNNNDDIVLLADTSIPNLSVENLTATSSNRTFTTRSDRITYYIPVTAGLTYRIDFETSSPNRVFSYSLQAPSDGVQISQMNSSIESGFTFVAPDNGYISFSTTLTSVPIGSINFYLVTKSALSSSVDTVLGTLNNSTVFGILNTSVPLIGVVTLVAVGFFIVRRAVRKLSKMRGGV